MIYIGNYQEVKAKSFEGQEDAKGVKKRVLIGAQQKAPHFIMRHFTIEGNGYSPLHSHWHEHEVFIVKGKGVVKDQNGSQKVSGGDFIYVPPNQKHQFLNPYDQPFEFLCLIPSMASKSG